MSRPSLTRAKLRKDLILEEYYELEDALAENDIVGVMDALGDIAYLVYGAAVEWGIDLDPVIAEIHRSNMTKTAGLQREDGKILKGPDYRPPDLRAVLKQQIDREAVFGGGLPSWVLRGGGE